MSRYQPPLTLTPTMLALVAEISEQVGRLSAHHESALTPQLRRGNRIRTIQASLAIENNTLSLEQVTAVLEGKRVLGLPREIQEVRNAFAAYEAMPGWSLASCSDLLAAHGLLMHARDRRGRAVPAWRGGDLPGGSAGAYGTAAQPRTATGGRSARLAVPHRPTSADRQLRVPL